MNPSPGSSLRGTGVSHHLQHTNANDSIEALEAKVGINGSLDETTVEFTLSNASSIDPGHQHSVVSLMSVPIDPADLIRLPIEVADGGTGASLPADARQNLEIFEGFLGEPVAAAGATGVSTGLYARADHAHEGVHSISKSGDPQITGDATLSAGTNVALSQTGNDIEVSVALGSALAPAELLFFGDQILGPGAQSQLQSNYLFIGRDFQSVHHQTNFVLAPVQNINKQTFFTASGLSIGGTQWPTDNPGTVHRGTVIAATNSVIRFGELGNLSLYSPVSATFNGASIDGQDVGMMGSNASLVYMIDELGTEVRKYTFDNDATSGTLTHFATETLSVSIASFAGEIRGKQFGVDAAGNFYPVRWEDQAARIRHYESDGTLASTQVIPASWTFNEINCGGTFVEENDITYLWYKPSDYSTGTQLNRELRAIRTS